MRNDIHPSDDPDISTRREVYDPGPSGTAVAGLIIGLIALAVALYGAFAPRETVRRGAEAVETGWQQGVETGREVAPEGRRDQPASSRPAEPAWTERAGQEMSRQLSDLKKELAQMRDRLDKSEKAKTGERAGAGASR